jgi:hypothetical protein
VAAPISAGKKSKPYVHDNQTSDLTRMQAAIDLIGAVFRAERPVWPWGEDSETVTNFLGECERQGVSALVHSHLKSLDWPQPVTVRFRTKAVQLAMWEQGHLQVLKQVFAAFAEHSVRPIVIKGTALAYTNYDDPALRTRGDTDLLIPTNARATTDELLRGLGFEQDAAVSGQFVSYQSTYMRRAGTGMSHLLDLHWRINNSEVLSSLFTYDELWSQAIELPELGPNAYGPSPIHSTLIACMHRATHRMHPYYVDGVAHHDADRIIWLSDIHLITSRFSAREWKALFDLADEKGLRGIVIESLLLVAQLWRRPLPPNVRRELTADKPIGVASIYLSSGRLRQHWMDFRALGAISSQVKFLRELFFPAPEYMRAKFQSASIPLSLLYVRRAIQGVAKRLRVRAK